MLIGLALAVCVTSVPLAGGSLRAAADVRLAGIGLLVGAVVVQALFIGLLAPHDGTLTRGLHLASYALAGGFVWANRRVPGVVLIALGGALNLAAIAANGGVMPARAGALRHAGLSEDPGGFTNSAVVADPHLAWLGDVFATPSGLPFSNVFSVGDLLLVLGAAVTLHALGDSRLAGLLRRRRRARRGASSPRAPRKPTDARPRG